MPLFDWEPMARLAAFGVLAGLFWSAEWLAPRRGDGPPRWPRQLTNLSMVALNTALLRIGAPLMAVDAAGIASDHEWGVLNRVSLPAWIGVLLAVLLLDLSIYWQHRFFHWWPPAWRVHRMHHSDTFFDVTTGVRFHPVEIAASMAIKIGAVLAIGASPLAVVLFEILLNGTSLFNHANLRIPAAFEGALRMVVVTPDMHRVHHSVRSTEHNRNFGFNLSVWDRLFNSYQAQPAEGQLNMVIGLRAFRAARDQTLPRLLLQPWAGRSAD